MIDYSLFAKSSFALDQLRAVGPWDLFISAFTPSERVTAVFDHVVAHEKRWLVFPEYCLLDSQLPNKGQVFRHESHDEDVFINAFLDQTRLDDGRRVCIDMTGFLRPHLLFLLRCLIGRTRLASIDFLYAEPGYYSQKEMTPFAAEAVDDVRPVRGYEGSPNPSGDDLLIIGAGYDPHLISSVCLNKEHARKIVLIGFPPLKPEMYQEAILKISAAADTSGLNLADESAIRFVPASDPFVTADVLQDIIRGARSDWGANLNIYLCPLATKAQALGFGILFECELLASSAAILFPFSASYSPETTRGIGRVWRFTLEANAVRSYANDHRSK